MDLAPAPTIASPIAVVGRDPEPSREAQARLMERFGARFFFRWYPAMRCFGVCARYGPEDARRQMVRAQEMSEAEAFDLLALLPPTLSLDDATGYVEHVLAVHPNAQYRNMARDLQRARETHVTTEEQAWLDEFGNQAEVLVQARGSKSTRIYMNATDASTQRVSDTKAPE